MAALRAFKLEFMPAFQAKFGPFLIIRLALRALHLCALPAYPIRFTFLKDEFPSGTQSAVNVSSGIRLKTEPRKSGNFFMDFHRLGATANDISLFC